MDKLCGLQQQKSQVAASIGLRDREYWRLANDGTTDAFDSFQKTKLV
jgi:hypothetical protein